MKKILSAVALFVGIALISPVTVQAQVVPTCTLGTELITNGDFETPVVTHPDKWDIFPSGGALSWTVEWVSNAVTVYNGSPRPATALLELQQTGHLGNTAFSGNQYAELDSDWFGSTVPPQSEPASVNIYQDIPTVPGAQYKLTFAFSPRFDAPDASQNILKVRADGNDIATISRAATTNTSDWSTHEYTITATGNTMRVEFADGGIGDSVGTYLDNVSLKCVADAPANGGNNGGGNNNGGGVVATTTPATTGGSSSDVAPLSGSSGGGSFGVGGSNVVPSGSTGGSSGTTTTSTTTPQGEVLGATTGYPGMPSTAGGNPVATYFVVFGALLLASEIVVRSIRKAIK